MGETCGAKVRKLGDGIEVLLVDTLLPDLWGEVGNSGWKTPQLHSIQLSPALLKKLD